MIAKSLSPYLKVKEVNWRYRPIPNKARYIFPKILYRTIECVYWSLWLFMEIYRYHADIIIAQYAYFTGFIGALAALISRRLCIIRAVGSDLKLDSQSVLGKAVVPWAIKNVSGVICVSKDLENIAKAYGAKSTIVIPSPLDLSDFDEKEYSTKDWEIISVAILKPIKGMSYLVKAMKQMKDSKLLIIGDGPERAELELLSYNLGLSDRVFFLGWVKHGLVWDYLQRSKVFVLPSLSEGVPRVLLEAMFCGLPIVATKVGGNPEVVTHGVNGFLVSPQNEEELFVAMKEVLSDKYLQKMMSIENKKKSENFALDVTGQRIYDYLEIIFTKQREFN